MKKIQKPFSIEDWRSGTKIETRGGQRARIICTNLKGDYPIAAATMNNDREVVAKYDTNGHLYHDCEDLLDLIIVEEVEDADHKQWAEDMQARGDGWTIYDDDLEACITYRPGVTLNEKWCYDVFATEEQAKSALAMARISQLMAHDERYGGVITEDEWANDYTKYCVGKRGNRLWRFTEINLNFFLAFHTEEQCDLFLSENEQLVKDYLMID